MYKTETKSKSYASKLREGFVDIVHKGRTAGTG